MSAKGKRASIERRQAGYGLLLVIFLFTVMLLLAVAVAPNVLTQGRREKEKEMIWRGKQYTRGVKLFYRKMNRFPTSLDDLTKPKIGSLRFMRQAYKDPMNTTDGSWRFIYVGASGQLIGSLKPPQNLQLPQAGGIGTAPTALNGTGTPGQPGSSGLFGGQPGPGGTPPGGATSGTNPPGGTTPGTNAPGTTGIPGSTDQSDSSSNPQPIPTGDTPNIVGGNIIGVGSKINKSSIIIYDRAKNYRLFEFIWDPSKDNIGVGQPGLQTGTGLGQVPGQTPFGQQPVQNPLNPQQNPGNPSQNPPQNPPQPQNP